MEDDSMDVSGDEMKETGIENRCTSVHSSAAAPHRPTGQQYCHQRDCTNKITKKNKHKLEEERVCESCWARRVKQKLSAAATSYSSSSAAATSSVSHLPITRSVLPAMPISYSFATHDWTIHRANDASRELAAEWITLNASPLSSGYIRSSIQNNPHHTQWSVQSAKHDHATVKRLADRTEMIVRAACEEVMGEEAFRFRRLLLVAFKCLESYPNEGWQTLHYDCVDWYRAKELASVLFYCNATMSTEFPLYDKHTMRPAFSQGIIATTTEQIAISNLIREEHFRSFPVKAGDMAIFRGNVCHRGINNPGADKRVVLYLLFSPSSEKNQDQQQRIPQPLWMRQPHSHLSTERRWAIINYHKLDYTSEAIALFVGCSLHTVDHWLSIYAETAAVGESPRSGRPTIPTPDFSAAAIAEPFRSTPRMLKAKLHSPVSKRTIRRRLNDDSLFGRVSRHYFPLSPESIRARLSFANGYGAWTEQDWMRVLYSDEKIFTLGAHGQVWVQRPRNAASDPKYVREAESHPDGINFWCCFSGRGTGGCETFGYNNTGTVMRGILEYHLLNSARNLFVKQPPELWWLLWDNSPIHRSEPVRNWLHNHGINRLDFPPYSADLNPTENLFDDLARRVEQRYPTTLDELEEAIHAEWPLTKLDYIAELSNSMTRRIKAVIKYQGHATGY